MTASIGPSWAASFYPIALTLLRIVAGFLFWHHGLSKLFGWFGGQVFPPLSLLGIAGIIEFCGAPMIMLGLFTRPVALLLSGEMAVAYLIQHLPQGFWPIQNQGVQALQFCVIFLLLAATGAGPWSLDGLLTSRSSGQPGRFNETLREFYPVALTVLRLMTAFLFWQYGVRKFFGWFGGRRVEVFALRWFAGIMESFGAPLIALGLFTRPLAFLLAGEMATAYWTSHFPRGPGFWPIQNGGEPAVLFCFIYLFLFAAGPGRFSLDGLLSRRGT